MNQTRTVFEKKCRKVPQKICQTDYKEVKIGYKFCNIYQRWIFPTKSCYKEKERKCKTVYEEKCEVTYSYGNSCTKVPTEKCEYETVSCTKRLWL